MSSRVTLHSPITAFATASQSSRRYAFGAELTPAGASFRLWAPKVETVALQIKGEAKARPMQADGQGWFELDVAGLPAGTLYRFVLPDGMQVPDPASRFQPQDVHGPSELIDSTAFAWTDGNWRGRPWTEVVAYELHLGTFTPEGTFRAAIAKLDHLRELGITAIEIMPVNEFPGARNWGYDGAMLFAPDSSYGRPEDFKALVDAAHARGIAVLLDVVYNHFGPDGNYLPVYAPLLTDKHKSPWGQGINYDDQGSDGVRTFVVENATYWIDEFHLDGLRLDAVHAIVDDSAEHILDVIAREARRAAPRRPVHLILENEENEASLLDGDRTTVPHSFTAQWNDDFHHALHVAVTGEAGGYYADYANDDDKLGRALAEGFGFQGEVMPYKGSERGEPSAHLPPTAFVSFMQNHDQIGNRAFGDRITAEAPPEAVRAGAAIYLLAPQIPMLFMGEEWAAPQPFQFFSDFEGELADAIRNGRRNEFKRFPEFQDPAQRERIPDPIDPQTFLNCKLDWDDLAREPHRDWLVFYRKLIALRHERIIPLLGKIDGHSGSYRILGPHALQVRWRLADGSATLVLTANLNASEVQLTEPLADGRIFALGEVAANRLGPWSVAWSLTN